MELLEELKINLQKRDVQLTLALVIVGLFGTGVFFAYRWYNARIESNAQKDFFESIDVYKQASQLENKKKATEKEKGGMWDEVEMAFKAGYEQNKKSNLAPFFLAYESDAQLNLGKLNEAYKNLEEVVQKLSKNLPYYYLYKIKLALIDLDKSVSKNGLAHLEELVNDKNNSLKDMAAFYLGEYYWSKNDFEKAKENYRIAESFNPNSTWANLSKMKLGKVR